MYICGHTVDTCLSCCFSGVFRSKVLSVEEIRGFIVCTSGHLALYVVRLTSVHKPLDNISEWKMLRINGSRIEQINQLLNNRYYWLLEETWTNQLYIKSVMSSLVSFTLLFSFYW